MPLKVKCIIYDMKFDNFCTIQRFDPNIFHFVFHESIIHINMHALVEPFSRIHEKL